MKFDAVFKRITAGLKDADRRRLFLTVDTFNDLPAAIKKEAQKQGDENGSGINGVFHRRIVYIVRDNISTAGQQEETIFHDWHVRSKAMPVGHERT
ncbi:MAG: hypothetical protein JZU65_13555, partial [Chlorobium sp.]|nr:hypothetical protein [Chlorobium sp.]